MQGFMTRAVGWVMIVAIRMYQVVMRPHLVGSCKFLPTCSDYAAQAVDACGPWRGGVLAVRRVCRCHPWGKGGFDPAPDGKTWETTAP